MNLPVLSQQMKIVIDLLIWILQKRIIKFKWAFFVYFKKQKSVNFKFFLEMNNKKIKDTFFEDRFLQIEVIELVSEDTLL